MVWVVVRDTCVAFDCIWPGCEIGVGGTVLLFDSWIFVPQCISVHSFVPWHPLFCGTVTLVS